MAPATMKQWRVYGMSKGFDELVYEDAPVPQIGDTEILVKLHAASLNYRDLIIPRGEYPFPTKLPVVAGSDGAGEVIDTGSKVTRWQKGDRVVILFNQAHQYGPVTSHARSSGVGGTINGSFAQYAAFNENGVVRAPKNLSFEEAASLTCAGLTAWNAFYGLRPLKSGDTVLVQGTGGVSIFALQFAKAAGAIVIATSSSREKCETLKRLGADHVINYKEDPNWGKTARDLTGGEGVDHIIEVGGKGTLEQSMAAIKYEGIVSIIGFLGGAKPDVHILETLNSICVARGIYVGSKQQMEDMVAAIEANDIHPVLDNQEFPLEKLRDAYEYMWSQSHFGKIPIKIE